MACKPRHLRPKVHLPPMIPVCRHTNPLTGNLCSKHSKDGTDYCRQHQAMHGWSILKDATVLVDPRMPRGTILLLSRGSGKTLTLKNVGAASATQE